MEITYDQVRNTKNIKSRGLSFELVANFDFRTAIYIADTRKDYGEVRIRSIGYLDGVLHALVFAETIIGIRVIGFRLATERERVKYGKASKS